MTPSTLLVIDDDPLILQCMQLCLPEPEYRVLTANTAERGIEVFTRQHPDAVLCDIQLPDRSGLAVASQLRELDRRTPVILITGQGTAETAITAMSNGAFDYVTKPFDPDEILPLIDSALETGRMAKRPAVLPGESKLSAHPSSHHTGAVDTILGQCPSMVEVFRSIGRVASRDVAVLILGETGTGKEVVARAIYQHSSRHDQIFHAINCAAIPETLLESELFGHEKGAFTGADQRRIGKFEVCDKGTLFLDEIGDMSPVMQTKLLRVLQEKEFERVGGSKPIKTDVRILAATHRNLQTAIADGAFRSDLYYRLNEFTIHLPALRDRGSDLPQMIDYFFESFARQLGKDFLAVAPETLRLLLEHDWPGNVRELQGTIKQTLLKASGAVIVPTFLPANFRSAERRTAATPGAASAWQDQLRSDIESKLQSGSMTISDDIHNEVDRILVTQALQACGGNLSETSLRLGISRPTLRSRMRQLGLGERPDDK
ncbi:sigma-54-dependent transcriptional regulator [Roseiconus lacunae]|uniref:sigma-54-dependent transcriptional regulator n=1 Tax=Roseiconus lacunae TaxID=2605694 RepID=UPI0011F0B98E|nr:sigma-54 dependent transcriptional regulator [Roseiconus lacunae]